MTTKPTTILIVDDDKTVIEQLVTHFRRRNYEPIATADPTTVQQTLEAFEVNLILLDLRMEKLNGYDVLKSLREKKINIPTLIITAYYGDEKERLEKIGITKQDVIEKPFRDFAKIESVISQKLNQVIAPGEVGSDFEDEIYYENRTSLLIVEDEAEITETLAEIFSERKYEVVTFDNGKTARDYLQKNPNVCQVAIIDMAIPGIPGYELIKEALSVSPQLRIIPVSSKYIEEVREKLQSVGFDASKLVTKPFDLPTLVEQVKVLAVEAGTLGSPVK